MIKSPSAAVLRTGSDLRHGHIFLRFDTLPLGIRLHRIRHVHACLLASRCSGLCCRLHVGFRSLDGGLQAGRISKHVAILDSRQDGTGASRVRKCWWGGHVDDRCA